MDSNRTQQKRNKFTLTDNNSKPIVMQVVSATCAKCSMMKIAFETHQMFYDLKAYTRNSLGNVKLVKWWLFKTMKFPAERLL